MISSKLVVWSGDLEDEYMLKQGDRDDAQEITAF